jgi:hypothetical protein
MYVGEEGVDGSLIVGRVGIKGGVGERRLILCGGEVPSDARDRVRADEVVVLTEECTNTTRHCIYMCDYPSNT